MNIPQLYQRLWLMLPLCCLLACSSDLEPTEEAEAGVPLQIDLLPMETRAAINGTTLPDNSQYGIFQTLGNLYFVLSDERNNAVVDYRNGRSTLSKKIMLDDIGGLVYAYYPYSSGQSLTSVTLETASQTDYLYGYAVDSNGGKAMVNQDNPVAHVRMWHAMALLRFNVSLADADTPQSELTGVRVYEKPVKCTMDLYRNTLSNLEYGNINVDCSMTVSTTPQTVEMLTIPYDENYDYFSFVINGQEKIFEKVLDLKAGNCYTLNVTIDSNGNLSVSEATITPRENTVMPSLNLNAEVLPIGGTVGTAVDLGLSVKWADHNLGTDSPEKYGGRYFWGDPTGSAKESDYVAPSLTEISNTKYDIAKAQWGGTWRLPTLDEIKELVENTTYQWTTRNGTQGGLFTSKKAGYTNRSIFIPWYGAWWSESGKLCSDVWSGTKSTLGSYARVLTFDEDMAYTGNASPLTISIPVRPVCNK